MRLYQVWYYQDQRHLVKANTEYEACLRVARYYTNKFRQNGDSKILELYVLCYSQCKVSLRIVYYEQSYQHNHYRYRCSRLAIPSHLRKMSYAYEIN